MPEANREVTPQPTKLPETLTPAPEAGEAKVAIFDFRWLMSYT